MKLMYITNNVKVAKIAERSGVDWIFIDLEINGKKERQGHLDTVISEHKIEDVKKVKDVLKDSKLLVRVNPIYEKSKKEVKRVLDDGADIVMLPFFKTIDEVQLFINLVGDRAEKCLLLETPEAVDNLDSILELGGIDYVHIGINDLHLGYEKKFMFELLADGTIEKIMKKIGSKGIKCGFGGIAKLGYGDLPAEKIIAEHYRLNSNMVILSRTFCNIDKNKNLQQVSELFTKGVAEIRKFEKYLNNKDNKYFNQNKKDVIKKVSEIVKLID